MNSLSNFVGYLTKRKQAYTGRPASAMYWDEKKGRYVIDGESSSEDEIAVGPPPMTVKKTPEKEKDKKDDEPASGESSLMQAPRNPMMAGRGRGRGGRGAPRFASAFDTNAIESKLPVPESPKKEEEIASLTVNVEKSPAKP